MSRDRAVKTPSSEEYRAVIGHFASGVTVVTTAVGDELFGTTASAVSSVSLEPPMLLICLNRDSSTGRAIDRSGYFVVNVLSEEQQHLAGHFATKASDKFGAVALRDEVGERPLIDDCLAHLECQVSERVTSATHIIFIGQVTAAAATPGRPLAYFRGRFARLELIEPQAEA
jgi:flavin reductase (DIM6/NTAB) family NADH-FMN oxidoreductase RutF